MRLVLAALATSTGVQNVYNAITEGRDMTTISRLAIGLFALFVSQCVSAFNTMPQDGIWGIDSETSLAVGRAFVLETAGPVTGVTFYNYNAAGAPTFYVGGGLLSVTNTVAVNFSEPRGGTCLGCVATSGSLLSSPGAALFEFTSSTTGFVTLPREARKAISKANLGFAAAPSGLIGGWAFTYLTGPTSLALADYAVLTIVSPGTSSGSGIVSNSTGSIACELQVAGAFADYVFCIKRLTSGGADKQMVVKWFGHHMDGVWTSPSSETKNVFTARRIVASSDQYGLKREAVTASPAAAVALREAMQAAIAMTPRPDK